MLYVTSKTSIKKMTEKIITDDSYFKNMLPPDEAAQLEFIPTIPEFVEWIEMKWRDNPALSDTEQTISYSEMCERIGRKRGLLKSLGLKQGERVAILDQSTPDAVEMFLAVCSAGFVAVNIPSQLPAPALNGACRRFCIKLLAYGEGFEQDAQAAGVKLVRVSDMADSRAEATVVDKNDPAAIFFTGGTTGSPKGAVLPHRAIMRGALNGCYAPGRQLACNRYAHMLPLSHVFGMIRGTMSALYSGALWVSCGNAKQTISKITQIRPTIIIAVPGICEILMEIVKMYGVGFLGGELRYIIAGAANVAPRLIREFDKLGVRLFAGYGLTEAGNLTSGNVDVLEKPNSVGKIYPGQEVKVVDGELWIRGDNVFLGYCCDLKASSEAMDEDGWLRTGDLVSFDDEGYMYIVGRIKNLILLSNGENISPESLEDAFYKCDKLRDCLVREDMEDGRGVIAVEIYPRMEEFVDMKWDEVEDYFRKVLKEVNSTLPSTHRISKLIVRKEDFKRTGTMKVSRNQ